MVPGGGAPSGVPGSAAGGDPQNLNNMFKERFSSIYTAKA